MVEVEFDYQQIKIIIQVNLDDPFEKAVQKFLIKSKLNIEELSFLSTGKVIKMNEIIKDIMSQSEIQENKKIILVVSSNQNMTKIIHSNEIICPQCKEQCKIEIKNYKIKLYECKNTHCENNIKLNEFSDTQNIDLTKIICGLCKKSKAETYKNKFFRCYKCNMNFMPHM